MNVSPQKNTGFNQRSDVRLERLLKRYSHIFRDDLPSGLPPKRPVDHTIELTEANVTPNRPIFQLSPAELLATKEYVTDLINRGKIRPSRSPFGAPLFFVKQKDKLRGVIDYRGLNRITKKNNAPIPRIDEIFDRLGGCKVFSSMDLKTGYHQIRINLNDIEKTAFKTRYGHFEFLVMPMGLCNAPATFQSLMNHIFRDCLDEFVVVYIDDLLIFSKTEEDHYRHIETVFKRLSENELYVGTKKCTFFAEEVEFLGLIVGKHGIRIGEDRTDAVRLWPKPSSITELRSFIGLLQFFRRFIKGFSEIAAPLTNLTRKGIGIAKWDKRCDEVFQEMKDKLSSAPILVPANWNKPFRCHTDASQFSIGGTLTQLDSNGHDRVIAYFSKRLSKAEENYTANDRELLALVYFSKRFRCYLEGSEFEIITDNQVLKNFLTKPHLSRRESRWLDLFSHFGVSKISHRAGKFHVLGDSLSRIPHNAILPEISNLQMISAQFPMGFVQNYEKDTVFGPIHRAMKGIFPDNRTESDRLKRLVPFFRLEDEKLFYSEKLCVPRKNVRDMLELAHDCLVSGHQGYEKTVERLRNFHWKHKYSDVKRYCQGCLKCQQFKDSRTKPFGTAETLDIPIRRWGCIASDFIVNLPATFRGFDAITTFVD